MQGFNMGRYVPPDLEGTTSFNKASGKGHALGARASKLRSEGILVVRFECPFPIWCTNCQPEQIIGQGVRFNAEKKKVGNYYSTPIWSFKIKHTVCGKTIEVRTDPKNAEYVVVEGGRRRDTGADKLLDGEIRIGATEEEKARLEKDGGFGALEKKLSDKKEADTQKRRIDELSQRSERDWADPYEMSKRLRREFRVGRRQRQADEKSGQELQDKFGLDMELLVPNEEDAQRAKLVDFEEAKLGNFSSKPLFNERSMAPQKATVKERGKRGIDEEAGTNGRKGLLQDMLRGNTRSLRDPFLSASQVRRQESWQVKVKKPKSEIQQEGTGIVSTKQRSGTPDLTAKTALVGYDSDSDSGSDFNSESNSR